MKKEDELMKALLQEDLIKKAEQIKKEVEQNPPPAGTGPDPGLKHKIWEQAEELRRQKEAYENLSEADKEALRLGKELQLRREEKEREEFSEELIPESLDLAAGAEETQPDIQNREKSKVRKVRVKKRRKKTLIALAVALVAVLGVGITSFGDKGFVTETVNRILGGRKSTNITAESDDADVTQQEEIEEEKVFQQIKDEFGFDPVRMDYKPIDMEMMDSIIDQSLVTASIYYQYRENILTYTIALASQDFSFGYDIEDTVVGEYTKTIEGVEIRITEYAVNGVEQKEYSAEFQYKDIYYILTGIIEKAEFEKILENLHFF